MRRKRSENSKEPKKFKDLEKEFRQQANQEQQIRELRSLIHQKDKKIEELEDYIDLLEAKNSENDDNPTSDEYLIAVIEIERLKKEQQSRPLSTDEIKAFKDLVNIKRLTSGQSTNNNARALGNKKDSELIKIIKKK
jgi:hypothetical protein